MGQKTKPKRSAGARILEPWDLGRNVVWLTHLQSDAADAQSVTLPMSVCDGSEEAVVWPQQLLIGS